MVCNAHSVTVCHMTILPNMNKGSFAVKGGGGGVTSFLFFIRHLAYRGELDYSAIAMENF